MYHAIAAVVLGHSLLRSLPEVNPGQIGITGISRGGVLTCAAAGVDNRFAFAVPTGAASLTMSTAASMTSLLTMKNSLRNGLNFGSQELMILRFRFRRCKNHTVLAKAKSVFQSKSECLTDTADSAKILRKSMTSPRLSSQEKRYRHSSVISKLRAIPHQHHSKVHARSPAQSSTSPAPPACGRTESGILLTHH